MAVKLTDIANKAGVSPTTVSMILNKKDGFSYSQATVEKITKIARELNYRPNLTARFMRVAKTNMIGVAVQSDNSYVALQSVSLCCDAIRKLQYEPILLNLFESEKRSETNLFNRIDLLQGIICIYPNQEQKALTICSDNNYNIPIVSLYRNAQNHSQVREVYSDHHAAFGQAVSYLHSLGHQKIIYAGLKSDGAFRNYKKDGFMDSITNIGLEKNIAEIEEGIETNAFEAGNSIATQLLSQKKKSPMAIVCSNDELALGLIATLMRGGLKVPEDVSVIGYDDSPFAAHTLPRLTTFRQPLELISSSAVKLLIACADGNENQKGLLPMSLDFKSELIVRDSTTAIK